MGLFKVLGKIGFLGIDHGIHKYERAIETKSLAKIIGVSKNDLTKVLKLVNKVKDAGETLDVIIKNNGKKTTGELRDIIYTKHDINVDETTNGIVEEMIKTVDETDGKVKLGDLKRIFFNKEIIPLLIKFGYEKTIKYAPMLLELMLKR